MPNYETREELEKAMQDAQTRVEARMSQHTIDRTVGILLKLAERTYRKPGECRIAMCIRMVKVAKGIDNTDIALLALKKVEEEEAKIRKK